MIPPEIFYSSSTVTQQFWVAGKLITAGFTAPSLSVTAPQFVSGVVGGFTNNFSVGTVCVTNNGRLLLADAFPSDGPDGRLVYGNTERSRILQVGRGTDAPPVLCQRRRGNRVQYCPDGQWGSASAQKANPGGILHRCRIRSTGCQIRHGKAQIRHSSGIVGVV